METITTNNNWKKKFIIIWTGQLFSILSSSIAQFSMVLWIGMETGSAEVLSYAAIAGLLPQILWALWRVFLSIAGIGNGR